jgi:hypothetical protein
VIVLTAACEHTVARAKRGQCESHTPSSRTFATFATPSKENEESLIKHGLGLGPYLRPEYEGTSLSLIEVYWKEGSLRLAPRDLNDFVWLMLLQHKPQVAICANRDGGCQTPYFLRWRRTFFLFGCVRQASTARVQTAMVD